MTTPPLIDLSSATSSRHALHARRLSDVPWAAVAATLLSIAGVFGLWSTALYLFDLWRTDPLKSIGAFVPLVSLALILRAWHALGWSLGSSTRDSAWGLALLVLTVALVHWRDGAVLELVLSPSWSIFFPPHSLVALAYVSGVVLLFGGTALYRAALFPILLILLVNPVPHVFNRFIDLPLQHASAATARAFAQALGQQLNPSQLSLMFTPSFGMFIAPGCNGIRGSVTMAFLALVAGFLYRFRLQAWALVVAGALLLGYVFNLVRLCILVVYYVVALRFPALQSRAEMADYVLGAVLFFTATVLLFTVILRLNPGGNLNPPPVALGTQSSRSPKARDDSFAWRFVAFFLLCALASIPYARGLVRRSSPLADLAIFPARQGPYTLLRTWQEKLPGGQTIFDWAAYSRLGSRDAVAVGVSPVLGAHDTLLCHTARGQDWLWHGELAIATAGGPVHFSGSLYSDGTTQSLEAATVCSGERCGQWSSARRHLGFVYSRTDPAALLAGEPGRPIPVLLKVETAEAKLAPEVARAALEAQLRDFLAVVSPAGLTRPYRVR